MSGKRISKRPIFIGSAICSLAIALLSMYFTMYFNVNGLDFFFNKVEKSTASAAVTNTPEGNTALTTETIQPTVTPAKPTQEPEAAFTDISIANVGDFLIHSNFMITQYNETDKTYDFNNIFSEVKDILSRADYSVGSLEVPFGGTDAGAYSGFPKFNCPDALAAAIKNAGIDMLMTAGTHAFDTAQAGVTRTISTIKGAGLENTGTITAESENNFVIKDIKGVKVGMVNYSAAERRNGKYYINGVTLSAEQEKLINLFEYSKLDDFYARMKDNVDSMKAGGAEVFIVYIRWGDDYKTTVNDNQKNIAKKLSDMGIDIIIGNGPHMIQPFEAIKSEVTGKTTLCMYSLGNFISNQRKELISYKSGHTEDGVIYTVNIRKYKDGKIELLKVDYVSTWLSLSTDSQSGKQVYSIIPLQNIETITDDNAKASYLRTKALIEESISKYNQI